MHEPFRDEDYRISNMFHGGVNMGYVLYGSKTSPFVRRIRILIDQIPYEFKEINLFEGQDAVDLNNINPINQIPVLLDGENTIWDSRQIFTYLNALHRFQNMDWKDENQLTAIDGALEAGVSLLMMKRSGINIDEQLMYVVRLKDRWSPSWIIFDLIFKVRQSRDGTFIQSLYIVFWTGQFSAE